LRCLGDATVLTGAMRAGALANASVLMNRATCTPSTVDSDGIPVSDGLRELLVQPAAAAAVAFTDGDGNTPLHLACSVNEKDELETQLLVLQLLLDHPGTDREARNHERLTPLLVASKRRIERSWPWPEPSWYQYFPGSRDTVKGNAAVVALLVKAGCDVEARVSTVGASAIELALPADDPAVVAKLLMCGAAKSFTAVDWEHCRDVAARCEPRIRAFLDALLSKPLMTLGSTFPGYRTAQVQSLAAR